MLALSDVIAEMDKTDARGNGITFALTFRSYDKKRKTAGEIITLKQAILSKHDQTLARQIRNQDAYSNALKNPFKHPVINITSLSPKRAMYAVHPVLITHFNNQIVHY